MPWAVRTGRRWKSFFLRDAPVHTASLSLTHNALKVRITWRQLHIRLTFEQIVTLSVVRQVRTSALVIMEVVHICVCLARVDSPAGVPTPETLLVWNRMRTSETQRGDDMNFYDTCPSPEERESMVMNAIRVMYIRYL